ncbi:MAG TPA: hypothetical protein VN039_03335 [Nitrospira sp.]|nr:hypothetical protein [Nitrospira sp.]
MELDQRYVVLKIKDLDNAISHEDGQTLNALCKKCESYRKARGAAPLHGLFIERDWPEHGLAMTALENRIGGEEKAEYSLFVSDELEANVYGVTEEAKREIMGYARKYSEHGATIRIERVYRHDVTAEFGM